VEPVRDAGARLLDRCARANGGAWRDPQHNPNHIAGPRTRPPHDITPVRDDASWQLAVAVAQARQALGLPAGVVPVQDERALVRRAYARLG
jgi:hypothetical protein